MDWLDQFLFDKAESKFDLKMEACTKEIERHLPQGSEAVIVLLAPANDDGPRAVQAIHPTDTPLSEFIDQLVSLAEDEDIDFSDLYEAPDDDEFDEDDEESEIDEEDEDAPAPPYGIGAFVDALGQTVIH